MRDVIVAGAFPPPVTGMSKNNEIIAADLARLARVRRVDLSPRTLTRSPGYHLARVLKALRGCLTIARNGWRRDPFLYIAADGGWGLAYTAALVLTARVFRHGVCVHHRSFATIDHPSWLMRAVVALAGRDARHVFLCAAMQRRFLECYPRARHALVSSNARHTPAQDAGARPASFPIAIGLLSNLGRDKGLHVFLDLMRGCVERGLPVTGVLAGPPDTREDEAAITAAQRGLAGLAYLGPLYGAERERFYRALDVFVFPTTYVNEAQPNVLFEAMSCGAAVISFARGCVAEDVTPACGLVVPVGEDFVAAALERLAHWSAQRDELRAAQAAAAARLAALHAAAAGDYARFLQAVSGVDPDARAPA